MFLAEDIPHYKPPKTRDDAERERRHSLAPGTIILEAQRTGLGVASLAFKLAKTADGLSFLTDILSESALAAAWYTGAQGAGKRVMRRVLDLTDLRAPTPEHRRSTEDIRYKAAWMLGEAAALTSKVIEAKQITDSPESYEIARRKAGRLIGSTAIDLASAGLGDHIIEIGGLSQADSQQLVRQRFLTLLDDTRNSPDIFGVPASIAQLADPYSNVSVFCHNNAPNDAMFALEEAWELKGVAA